MATSSKSTSARKPSTSRAVSATNTSKSDTEPDATTPDNGGSDTGGGAATSGQDTSETPASGDTTADPANDPAAALKQRMRTTQHVDSTRPDDLTDEQRLNLVGAPPNALPGPRTLSSPTAPTRKGAEYVTVDTDGYVAVIQKNTQQPATTRVWVEGQRVRKDMHDALSGVAATEAKDAPVLDGDTYAQVAPYL